MREGERERERERGGMLEIHQTGVPSVRNSSEVCCGN